MKINVPKELPVTIDLRALFLGVLFFGILGFIYYEVRGLRSDLDHLNAKLEFIENEQTRTRSIVTAGVGTIPPVPETTPVAAPLAKSALPAAKVAPKKPLKAAPLHSTKSSSWTDDLFALLRSINENHDVKRIFYHPGAITVADATLASEDAFFELLGYLMDEEHFKSIELPPKIMDSPLKKGLIEFGISPSQVRTGRGNFIKILVKEAL